MITRQGTDGSTRAGNGSVDDAGDEDVADAADASGPSDPADTAATGGGPSDTHRVTNSAGSQKAPASAYGRIRELHRASSVPEEGRFGLEGDRLRPRSRARRNTPFHATSSRTVSRARASSSASTAG